MIPTLGAKLFHKGYHVGTVVRVWSSGRVSYTDRQDRDKLTLETWPELEEKGWTQEPMLTFYEEDRATKEEGTGEGHRAWKWKRWSMYYARTGHEVAPEPDGMKAKRKAAWGKTKPARRGL